MSTLESLTSFFGWFTIVNVGLYIVIALAVMTMRDFMVGINAKLFGIPADDVKRYSFAYIGNYKLAITFFAFAPWVALKLMA
ncbi:MAG: DUF6868 family protein [Pseudomonadota bacterium]